MPHSPTYLYDVCDQLLAAVVTRHGGTLPDRQLVSAGRPPWDCPLVAAWCERTAGYAGDPSAETTERHMAMPGWAMRAGTFAVTIVRDYPVTEKVTPTADLEASSQQVYGDAQRMMAALVAAARADELPGCHSIAFLDWTLVGPEGGMVAGELRLRVGLLRGA